MRKKLLLSLMLLQSCSLTSQTATEETGKAEIPNLSSAIRQGDPSMQHLLDKQWQLVSFFSAQGMQAAMSESPATLVFSGYKVSGSTGCNQYFAAYQLSGQNGLQFSQAGSTMMACPAIMAQQEQQLLQNLAEIDFYQIQDEQLQLIDAQQQSRLIFKVMPALTLQGIKWQVTGINNGQGGVVSNAHTGQAYLQFTAGKLQGTSGCNTLAASYQSDTTNLTVDPVRSTRKRCPENDLMLQEQQILQALAKVTHYEIRTNQLRLLNKRGSLVMILKPG